MKKVTLGGVLLGFGLLVTANLRREHPAATAVGPVHLTDRLPPAPGLTQVNLIAKASHRADINRAMELGERPGSEVEVRREVEA